MSKAQRDIRRRRQVLEYAVQIRNIRKTCRHFGMPRSLFYVWRAGFERDGEAGLVNKRLVPAHIRAPRARKSWSRCGTCGGPITSARNGSSGTWRATRA